MGLAEALTSLTGIFSGAGAPLQSMTTAQHRHTFLQCEPGLWFVLVRRGGRQRVRGGAARRSQVVQQN